MRHQRQHVLHHEIDVYVFDRAFRRSGARELEQTGYDMATRAGISINVVDMIIPKEKVGILDEAYAEVDAIVEEYNEGSITNGERYNKVVDVWSQTTERLVKVMLERISKDTFVSEVPGEDYQ